MKKIKELCKLLLAVLLSKFLPKKHYWIVAERGYDARDNGYWFFLYLKKEHPEISSLYFITHDSADSYKLAKYADSLIVPSLSVKAYIKLCQSEVFAGTHGLYWLYPRLFTFVLQTFCGTKFVFLQHGVILNLVKAYCHPTFLTDLFICGAKPEYDYICSYYGFKDGIARLTGLCRFDNLYDKNVKRQILLMPTWRRWMWTENVPIEQNEWVKTYAHLLQSDKLRKILEENDLELLFYPHVEAQKYMPYFKSLNLSAKIGLLSFNTADVQTLLKESSLLITDYSSVFVDFAYMEKPIIFYQFDNNRFRKEHQALGYFDYSDSFGVWCDSEIHLLNLLQEQITKGFVVEDVNLQKINEFFPVRDRNNCKRVFNAITSIV